MQIHAQRLLEFSLDAKDGEIGKIKDIYFDDHTWELRYFIVETGSWLFQRKVLISPDAVDSEAKISSNVLPVNLTKDQVEHSPNIDTDMPVSRQMESSLFDYYSWPLFGRAGMGYPTTGMLKGATAFANKVEREPDFDPHLRSFKHIAQYEVWNAQGRVGLAKDFIINTSDWKISFLLLDDASTSDRERVVVAAECIISVDWDTYKVKISLKNDEIQSALRINPQGFFAEDSDRLPPFK
ncbi:hypothetical protein PBAL39_15449 [Pedobacter sp. BAL39]|uniref:PRC-barrel domain-containing protein n=1 Tax=Pedobacter sp. BAL39 TaxID=391596 RepID=UPI0001559DB9|nr:PRC-barrel domain-containing protein [Pedobacter sp. BAL39]EDM37833.1 hypothetical protein PBAL39_15449 [Pedobacter sp. BAL39]